MSGIELSNFPEELLEGILGHCVIVSPTQIPVPSWIRSSPPTSKSSKNRPSTFPTRRTRLSVLLVSKQFHRIALPLYYHTIHIVSPRHLHFLLTSSALRRDQQLAGHIQRLVFKGIWAEGGELLRMCASSGSRSLKMLDMTIDFDAASHLAPGLRGEVVSGRDLDVEEFCEGLNELEGTSLKQLVIRKPNNVYLTQPKPKYFLAAVAEGMKGWKELESVELAFRLSDDSGTNSILQNYVTNFTLPTSPTTTSPGAGCITAITSSLGALPKLHTFTTLLPSMWNESILRISKNPALERIVLGERSPSPNSGSGSNSVAGLGSGSMNHNWPTFQHHQPQQRQSVAEYREGEREKGILGTGLFFTEAKKHSRLCELIKAGTSIIRTRAHTLDALSSTSTSGSSSLSSSPAPSTASSRSTSPSTFSQSSATATSASTSTTFGSLPKDRNENNHVSGYVAQQQSVPYVMHSSSHVQRQGQGRARAVSTRR